MNLIAFDYGLNHVRGFAKRLRSRFELPVVEVDERFSSVEAQHRIAAMRRRGQKTRRATHADVDAVAAALLLERYFDNDPRADTGSSAGDDH
ncbi:MAG: hypothetical protein CSA54_00535 [Gammaproteobacteria bacterium]|nr:MAG: hypothetical protein CSA54_00535 [Gammaproteobacteria bacterium]